ncbi:AcrR family transcriptional regulator [Cytobacillus horneckiae]|uniref:TetR/AcrR family transcriptional regulator n=1 Tax=Cytobacillus horneckiae TaxID=549687 RepID=A0A2N0ZMN9_9BACI|nr:TetR/AcrR family transcriptional regulator [Cytobacillus horneckiae]MBN6886315.1 TetR/AcrR family transcriptional regulator [Cytobacillus horneckiae]MCM3176558.1 TetR/AcrR family transcriptional regulator [Cytobacillus horneckiae]MEC1159114.1 TetR/AcrR family transcriptional regulator [Cytobacillus horneckiae]MED2938806.1 TetR/AcrR family transcriptional regulator [Cytobacillus horneckiae]PKG30780.1 TetR/AcrR family transcriptional regulator [Cytobacillus horneckiae]
MIEHSSKISKQGERTKSHLKQAFIALVNEKGYSHVTVTDMIKRAKYNRTTFYLYYHDKQCLAEELQFEMFARIKEKSISKYEKGKTINITDMGPTSFELTHFIFDNQAFFNLYLKNDTIPGLYKDLPLAIYEVLEESFILSPVNKKDINHAAHKLYMAHGTAGLIMNWIKTGYSLSADEMSQQLINILQSFAKEFSVVSKRSLK